MKIFKMTLIILLLNLVTTVLSETSARSGSSLTDTTTSLNPPAPVPDIVEYGCACNDNSTSYLRHKATVMQEQMKNKTSMFNKIRHRATHSNEALWASLSLSLVLILLIIGTLQSKMWQDRPSICYMDSQPIRYDSVSKKSEILIKAMLKSRVSNFTKFSRHRKHSVRKSVSKLTPELNMTSFLEPQDDVDSSNKWFLRSSSESSCDNPGSSSDEEEGNTFWMNKRTGTWEAGTGAGSPERVSRCRKRTNVRYNKESSRIRITSLDSQTDLISDSSLMEELRRESSSCGESESETAALIKI